ncbi:MAG: extracellular solute-binding protein [Anaerolineae bacterium]
MEHKYVTRRQFVQWSAVAAGAMTLAACAPSPAAPAETPTTAPASEVEPTVAPTAAPEGQAAGKQVEVRFGMWDWYAYAGSAVRWDEWNQNIAFPEFMKDHANIKLVWEPQADFDKVLTTMAAGTCSEIISCWSPDLEIWAEKKQLLDLQPLVDRDIPDADKIFMKNAWDQMIYPFTGERIGMLADQDVTSVYYNKQAFEEAGVPLPTDDWTTDDFINAAQALTVTDDSGQVTRWGADIRGGVWTGELYYVETFGGQVRDEDTRMVCLLGEPEALEGLEYLRHGRWDLNCFAQPNQMSASGLPNVWTDAVPAGLVAMAERSADQFFSMAENMEEGSWDIAHTPKTAKGRSTMGLPDDWVVYVGVNDRGNKEETWEFMKFLTGEWYQEKVASVAGRIPCLLSQTEKWAETLRRLEPKLAPVNLEAVLAQNTSGEARRVPMFKYQAVASELIDPAMQAIFTEGTSPVDSMKEIADQVTQAQQDAEARGTAS